MFKAIKRWLKPTPEEYKDKVERYIDRIAADAKNSTKRKKDDVDIDEAWDKLEEEVKAKPSIREIAESLEVGDLSQNVNWMHIEHLGQYLSPVGTDRTHTVTLTKKARNSGTIVVARILCTNAVYSEWIQCLCQTMWHIQHKVLEDVCGNKYPVGQMLELECSVRY